MQNEKQEKSKKLVSQYKKVFSTPEGRAVLHDLMKGACAVWKDAHVRGDSDSTFKNIGKQELIVDILRLLKMDPEQFLALINEQEGSHV